MYSVSNWIASGLSSVAVASGFEKSSTRLVTSGYAVLMIQATLPLRHYTAHLLHWPCTPGQKSSGYDQELAQTQTTDGTVKNLYNQHAMLLKNFKIYN